MLYATGYTRNAIIHQGRLDANVELLTKPFTYETLIRKVRQVLDAGGALSHHHGVGLNRARFVHDALGTGFDVLASVKRALDPHGILNPGKLGLPSPFGDVPWP